LLSRPNGIHGRDDDEIAQSDLSGFHRSLKYFRLAYITTSYMVRYNEE
jgi:hypothetical protein